MRTPVDIPSPDLPPPDELAQRSQESRAKIVRAGVNEYLTRNRNSESTRAFGLWEADRIDGVDYQKRLRAEW